MGETKKVGLTGRFGSRYGVGIRKRVLKTESAQRKKHQCPVCEKINVKRTAAGIFECNSCGNKFAGGAFIPETLTGKLVKKMISQKKFSEQEFKALEEIEETLNKEKELEKEAKKEIKEKTEKKPETKKEKKEIKEKQAIKEAKKEIKKSKEKNKTVKKDKTKSFKKTEKEKKK
jgi:large subunit ribosomal protein L37Ae